MVHDKLFTTIPNHSFDNMTALWDELCSVSRGNDWEQEVNEFGKEIPVPIVSSDWKDDKKLKELREKDKLRFDDYTIENFMAQLQMNSFIRLLTLLVVLNN